MKTSSGAKSRLWNMKSKFARKDKDVHQDGIQKTSSGAKSRFWNMKSKFARKDKDVHQDGIQRIRCPKGITEKDIDMYFQHLAKDYGQEATQSDNDMHVQALELLRTHKAKVFQNAELTIVGVVCAVRFVAGKGRRKFRIELLPAKVLFQVHVENVLCGFIRTTLFIAAMLEALLSMMSAWSVMNGRSVEPDDDPVFVAVSDKPDDGVEDDSVLVALFMVCGDITRGLVGFLAAMETINSSAALFTPVYGRGYGRGHDQGSPTYGVGVWPVGPRRWLYRGLLYAAVACRDRLHVLRAADFLLPVDILNEGLLYSGLILAGAAFLSVLLHVLHVPFPSLLKAPWTSVTLPSDSPQQGASSDSGPDSDTPPPGNSGAATGTLSRIEDRHLASGNSDIAPLTLSRIKDRYLARVDGKDGVVDQEDGLDETANDVKDLRRRCCPDSLPVSCHLRPCTVSLCLQSVALFLCLTTALLLSICHVTRLIESVGHQPALPIMQSVPATAAAILICTAVGAYQAIGFVQTITMHRFAVPLTMRASLLLHAVGVSTVWSRDVVTWLTESCGWSGQAVGVALMAGSVMSLLLPALLRSGDAILARWKHQPRCKRGRTCVSCGLSAIISRELVQRVVFMAAVLLAVTGMTFAVISLPLPIARVRSEYTDDLLEAVEKIRGVQATSDDHYKKMLDMIGANICGGTDVAQLKKEMYENRQAAASLTVKQLRGHCDDMKWKNSVKTGDAFCKDYGAARLYLNGSMAFNSVLHDTKIKQLRGANRTVQDNYFNQVIMRSRGEQLKELEYGETSLTDGAFKTRDECVVAMCIAQNVALATMLIPFVGIGAKIAYLGLTAVEAALRLIIKLSKVQLVFLEFKTDLEILVSKFAYYREEKTIQFSLANFNLIYLAYPALLTGCVGVLVGFWYRRGAPLAQRRRASVMMLLPLIFLNLFGLGVSFAWSYIVMVLGEVAPMIQMTVTAGSALIMLRVSYGFTLSSLVLFLLLGFVESRHVRSRGQAKKDCKAATGRRDLETDETEATELTELTSIHVTAGSATSTATDTKTKHIAQHRTLEWTAASTGAGFKGASTATEGSSTEDLLTPLKNDKVKTKSKVKVKGVKVTQGVESRGMVWVLALLISMGSACLMTMIIWKPVFAFDFDLNAEMKTVLERVDKDLESSTVARLGIYNDNADRCHLVDFIAKRLVVSYMNALKNMVFDSYKGILRTVQIKSQVTAIPAIQLIQIPLLLTTYLPLTIVLWSLLMTKIRPSFAPPPRSTARLISAMAWMSMGWLTSGVLFLVALAQGNVVPMFRFQVYLGEGFSYVMAANVMLIMASQELRIAMRSPVL